VLADRAQALWWRHPFTGCYQQGTGFIDVEVVGRATTLMWPFQSAGIDRSGEMRFVWNLFLGKAHIAVNAKQRFFGIAACDRRIELAEISD
jgi:hypothetical protein